MSDTEYTDWQDGTLVVVVNNDGHCSIWPVYRDIPAGWNDAGMRGDKSQCLEFIKAHSDADGKLIVDAEGKPGLGS